jgi:hypothetical protein
MRKNPPRQFKPGHARQIDIEHTDVGRLGKKYSLAAFSVGCFQDDDVRLPGEQGAAAGGNNGMIIYDQDAHWQWFQDAPASQLERTDRGRVNRKASLLTFFPFVFPFVVFPGFGIQAKML